MNKNAFEYVSSTKVKNYIGYIILSVLCLNEPQELCASDIGMCSSKRFGTLTETPDSPPVQFTGKNLGKKLLLINGIDL